MRKFFKYFIRTLGTLLILLLLAVASLYIPAVQRSVVKKAVKYAETRLGMKVEIGRFALRFPLDLVLEKVYASRSDSDTLGYVSRLHLDVGLAQMFRKRFEIREFSLEEVVFSLQNDTTGLLLKIRTGKVEIERASADLAVKRLDADRLQLGPGYITLRTGRTERQTDTVKTDVSGWIFGIRELAVTDVFYEMSSGTLPCLYAGVREGRLSGGKVDLAGQRVVVDKVSLDGGMCRIQTSGDTTDTESPPEVGADTTFPWTIEAGLLEMGNASFSLSGEKGERVKLVLTDIGIRLDSIYNRGTVVRADLEHLQLIRPQGGRITDMQAEVDLDTARTSLKGMYLQTPASRLQLTAWADTGLTETGKNIPLHAVLEASLGGEDIRLFWPQMPSGLDRKMLKVSADITYREEMAQLRAFTAQMPGNFRLSAEGNIRSFRRPKELSGQIEVKGNFQDINFLQAWLGKKVHIPAPLELSLEVAALRGNIRPRLRLCDKDGCLFLTGHYDIPTVVYDLEVRADRFDFGAFLPSDSLGFLTAEARIDGRGYRWGETDARLLLDIGSLGFKRHSYRNIRMAAEITGEKVNGLIRSRDPDLLLDMRFTADSVGQRYAVGLSGKVDKAALGELHLQPGKLDVALDFDIKGTMSRQEEYRLDATVSGVKIEEKRGMYDLGGLVLRLDSDLKATALSLVSGDFSLNFLGNTAVTRLSAMLAEAGSEIARQVREYRLDMERIQALLPGYTLTIHGSTENVLGRYLQLQGIRFREVNLETASRTGDGVFIQAALTDPVMGKIGFDSVTFSLQQRRQGVVYGLHALNPRGIVKDLYDVTAYGSIDDNRLEIAVQQKNKTGETGIAIGTNLIFRDSSLTVNFFPENPTLGYGKWMMNVGNQLTFYKNGNISADLRMAYEEKLVSIQSLGDRGEERRRLQIDFEGIDLASFSKVIPFFPELKGILHTDLLLYSLDDRLIADGELLVRGFYYGQQRIGDLGLDISYNGADRFTDHTVGFKLYLDEVRRAVIAGNFATSGSNRGVNLDVDILSLPLYVVNVFVPANMVELEGDVHGRMNLRGSFDTLQLDGGIAFRRAEARLTMLGTAFGIDSAFIPIENGKVLFRNFRFISPNRKALTVNGDIGLLPLEKMAMDLAFSASGFQVVNVKANSVSLVYGKAYVDLAAALKGAFGNLNLTGNVELLNSTDVHYVLRTVAPELKDRTVDLVRFVSFRDTTLSEKDLFTDRINTGSFVMKLFIGIGEAVSVTLDLSENEDNEVAIRGGGNLTFSITPEAGNNLIGKYTLNEGSVRYAVPVVGEKNFTIQNGSYIEWTGPIADPAFHITASESVRVSVTEDNQSSRLVNFDVLILIRGDLIHPRISFDLSTPNDQAIQGQLAAFSPEERTKQAMNLLIYGTYSGPGVVNTGTGPNNTLNNFVEKELNQWSRRYLKNVGLTFGIDSYNQIGAEGQEVKRTDYSYQFSKQLFNDKINVKVGGRISTDDDPGSSMEENLVDDIAIEYRLTKNRDWFLKVFRHTNYESVLEGEVTQTGVGIVLRKSFRKIKDLFVRKSKREKS